MCVPGKLTKWTISALSSISACVVSGVFSHHMIEKFVAMDTVFCLFTFIRHPKLFSVRVGSLTMYSSSGEE